MKQSDCTSTNISSGNVSVFSNQNLIFLAIAGLFIYFLFKKSKKKSGMAILNISVSPHNEKVGIALAIIGIVMYGYHIYLESKHIKKDE